MNPGRPHQPKDRDPETTGRRIAHLRVSRGLTQTQLAAEVGVQGETVRRWEAGMRITNADSLIRVADALDVDPRELWVPRRAS